MLINYSEVKPQIGHMTGIFIKSHPGGKGTPILSILTSDREAFTHGCDSTMSALLIQRRNMAQSFNIHSHCARESIFSDEVPGIGFLFNSTLCLTACSSRSILSRRRCAILLIPFTSAEFCFTLFSYH